MTILVFTAILLTGPSAWGNEIYTKYPGYKMQSPCIPGITKARSFSGCVARCSQVATCVSGSYDASSRACCLSERLIYLDGVTFIQDSQSIYFQEQADVVWHGNWVLVFRASMGIGDSVYAEFLDTSRHDDHPVGGDTAAISCWSLSGSHSCHRHLRSRLLNTWEASPIKKVKYSYFNDGAEVRNAVFNGAGSKLFSWFHMFRILSSTYTDMATSAPYDFFSIAGRADANAARRFYISTNNQDCQTAEGWLAVVEQPLCSWETFPTYPRFLYSQHSTCSRWDTGGTQADVMAIFVQF